MKFAPHKIAACIEIADSIIAWPSGNLGRREGPGAAQRQPGAPASWPPPRTERRSGVPNVGDPERSAIEDKNCRRSR